jgi:hypothetical protein
MAQLPQMGWSPNPIFNQWPLHAVAPTPLGAQAQALMSPGQPQGTPGRTLASPMNMSFQPPASAMYYTSPGPAQSLLNPPPPGPPGRFEHYVPSVRYQPTEYDIDDEDFVLVDEKEYIPKAQKRSKRRLRAEPCGLIKGVKNIFRKGQDALLVGVIKG